MSAPKITPELFQTLRASRRVRKAFPPDVAAARYKEQCRRNGGAQQHAYQALRALHPDEYQALYWLALEEMNACGPLPGDEDA